ncbi:UNVERIFIED_CONTAM: hypothetical protein Sradi_0752100 [Sesamum radiatum]|uniref:Retrotransposon gag domain-containing protein n=1 Tax=Sesamum radiatum TaxID=300843 RepID=A0AAW2VTS4_SESRA
MAINLFGVKQEENETLRAYIESFNIAILEVPAPQPKVQISVITQGLPRQPLFESLAKKPASDFYVLLARVDRYINLEDAQLKKDNKREKMRDTEGPSSHNSRGNPEDDFNTLTPKSKHLTPLITSPARMLMVMDRFLALQWSKGSEVGPQLHKSIYFCR